MFNVQAKHARLPRKTALATCLAAVLAGGSLASAHAADAATFMQRPSASHAGHAPALLRQPGERNPRLLNQRLLSERWNQPLFDPPIRPAAVIAVGNCDDAGPGSLREAAFNAVDGDEIDLQDLACSTITLTSGAITTTAPNLTLNGPGYDLLTIDGNYSDSVLVGQSLVVNDLTLANGTYAGGSGGCTFTYADLSLTRSLVTGCSAGDGTNALGQGGGVGVLGNLTMTDSAIVYSSTQGGDYAQGGGAYVLGSALLVRSTVFTNTATVATAMVTGAGSGSVTGTAIGVVLGGGIHAEASVTLTSSSVIGNMASSTLGTVYGGGVSSSGDVQVLQDSLVSGNTAQAAGSEVIGGGISAGRSFSPGNVLLDHSVLYANTASVGGCDSCAGSGGGADAGGEIRAYYSEISGNRVTTLTSPNGQAVGGGLSTVGYGTDGSVFLFNSTVSGNSATGGAGGFGKGGGIGTWHNNGVAAINSTVAFNSATTAGGGIMVGDAGSPSDLESTIVANNEAPDGADIGSNGPQTVSGLQSLVMQAGADVTLPGDTLSDDPLLGPLESNGSERYTHAIGDCSPAFDTGITAPPHFTYDQRGEPFLRNSGAAVDIGAFELQIVADRIFSNGFDPSLCP